MSRHRHYILNADGEPEPTDLLTAGRWFEHAPERIVAFSEVGAGRVSTIFLCFDHQWDPDGPPVLWETMIFDIPGHDGDQWRYSSRAEAVEGHARAVAIAEAALEAARKEG